ncbi:hypothetical protein FM120_04210 [Sphingobacterium faecium PCAi_F2.5]|nr:hypothetical protein FM120_04210 [Sphingobacterium faecium PCAi_F2.5]
MPPQIFTVLWVEAWIKKSETFIIKIKAVFLSRSTAFFIISNLEKGF